MGRWSVDDDEASVKYKKGNITYSVEAELNCVHIYVHVYLILLYMGVYMAVCCGWDSSMEYQDGGDGDGD